MAPLLLVLLAASGWAAQDAAVYRNVIKEATRPQPGEPVPVSGQSQHLVQFEVSDRKPYNCVQGYKDRTRVQLEGSFDQKAWVPISAQFTVLPNSGRGYGFAHGAFPYVRVNVTYVEKGCALTAWYSASAPAAAVEPFLNQGALGYRSMDVTLAEVGEKLILPLAFGKGALPRISIHGMVISGQSAGEIDVYVKDGSNNVRQTLFNSVSLSRGPIILPPSCIPNLTYDGCEQLYANLSWGGAVTVRFIYRLE